MALNALGRNHLLEHGKQTEIANALNVTQGYVSQVVNARILPRTPKGWKRYRKVQRAIAHRLGMTVEDAFSEYERGVAMPDRKSEAA